MSQPAAKNWLSREILLYGTAKSSELAASSKEKTGLERERSERNGKDLNRERKIIVVEERGIE